MEKLNVWNADENRWDLSQAYINYKNHRGELNAGDWNEFTKFSNQFVEIREKFPDELLSFLDDLVCEYGYGHDGLGWK